MAQAEIARLIETHRDKLVQQWVAAVRADNSINSDADLSEGGLIDHVPMLLDELCLLLRVEQWPGPKNTHEARVHAYTRFRQGYRARDLVREVALLRLTLLDHIQTKLRADPDHFTYDDLFNAMHTLNHYLDEELRYGVAIYTESNATPTQPLSGQTTPLPPLS
jgi:RsbT co-antagonist protein rsbRD N-terminal domain